MTCDPGFHNPQGTPIYEDLVQDQGDVLADSRAAAEAARRESGAALPRPARDRPAEEDGSATVTGHGAGEAARFA